MAEFKRRQILRTGLAAGAVLASASAAHAGAPPDRPSAEVNQRLVAQASAGGYDRQLSALLVRACALAVEQFQHSLSHPDYDGNLSILSEFSPFARYRQVASFRGVDLSFSDAHPPQTDQSSQVANKTLDPGAVAISVNEVFFGYALTSDTNNIIALRGTQTGNEWLGNLSARQVSLRPRQPQYGRVHRGFQATYERIITQIKRAVPQLNPALPLYITGHSLGGAVAMLTAADLIFSNDISANRVQVYTYGSPRVGDPTFVQYYNGLVPRTFRVVNLADSVPITPPESFQSDTFQHAGQEWSYLSQLGSFAANHETDTYKTAIDRRVEVNQSRSYPISALCS
jgi:hypothetical protein